MAWRNDQVSQLETQKIIAAAKECLAVAGDFVELGCYKGDTSLLLAEVVQESNITAPRDCAKKLWIYDSFEGLPEKSAQDSSALGRDFQAGELLVSKKEVKQRFLRAGLSVPIITKKWFDELQDEDLPEKISFAFLDGDFYESIKDSFHAIEGKMADGGVIIVHDYCNAALPGVEKAVNEWCGMYNKQPARCQTMAIIKY